jgi:hypothetical protein
VFGTAGKAVAGPDHNDIELAAVGILEHSIESWPTSFPAADAVVRVFLDDLKSALSSEVSQFVELILRVLIDGRDAHVQGGTLHTDASGRYVEQSLEPESGQEIRLLKSGSGDFRFIVIPLSTELESNRGQFRQDYFADSELPAATGAWSIA